MNELKMKHVEIDLLVPYTRNAKIHPEKQIEQIMSSIKEFGFLQPILIDKEYNIIAGHGRVEAAKRLKMLAVPCIVADHLSESQRRAFVLVDNRLNETSEWDKSVLKLELEEIDIDLSNIGFSLSDIKELNLDAFMQESKMQEPSGKARNKEVVGATELNENDFSNFDHKCPKCGFEFNGKK